MRLVLGVEQTFRSRVIFCAKCLLFASLVVLAPIHRASKKHTVSLSHTKLNNPTASLISVPFQSNCGPNDDDFQYRLNLQPVIPFKLTDDWKILSRTIVTYIYQEDRIGTSSQSGLGDSTVTLWFSPDKNKPGAPIWGSDPSCNCPRPRTIYWARRNGVLARRQSCFDNHMGGPSAPWGNTWSFAGESSRQDVSVTFVQPFINYTTKKHTTFGFNTESTYDWENKEWTVPLNLFVTQLVKIGKMPVSFQFGGRYYGEKPSGGPDWGLRFTVTLVFPE